MTEYRRRNDHLNVLLVAQRLKPAMVTDSILSLREISILELIAENHNCPFVVLPPGIFTKYNEFYMGVDQAHLDDLLYARGITKSKEKKLWSLGRALGYPEPAVNAFIQREGNAIKMFQSLANALSAHIEIPSWLAYISHIPEELDLCNGKIAPTSKEIGEKYQSSMRNRYPKFSKKLEESFQEELKIIGALMLSAKA